jgi:FAD/FMN-containing dehydrogenase
VAARGPIIDAAVAATPESEPVVDVSYRILSNVRNYRFNEMEYSVPLDAGAPCVLEILRTIEEKQIDVVFPLEYRYVAGDDLWLSMFSGGPRASISVHRDARFDYRPYFDVVEPIFWKYGGRPHWGKVHSLKYPQLSALYPHFRDFLEMRAALDPTGRMLNDHLRGLFGITT